MAFDLIQIVPVTGSALTINTNDIPVTDLETDPEYSSMGSLEKMQLSGEWYTWSMARGMGLVMEGAIFGRGATDALMAADTATRRQAFMTAWHRVHDTTPPTSRVHGSLRLQATGWTEAAAAPYHVVNISAPYVAGQPNIIEWHVSLHMFNIYFLGESSSTKYYV